MIIPSFLKKNDTICIIATARKISKDELDPAITLLQNYGFKVILGKHIYAKDNQFAGTDYQRSEDLQYALDNNDVKAIIIARGGYGTVRLLKHVDFTNFVANPKWIVGYSDVTVLHSAIHQLGIATLHATMPINFGKHKQATQSLIAALLGTHDNIIASTNYLNKLGTVKAKSVGGNLSLLYSLAGTNFDIDVNHKILFIEDLDEQLYHIDRMMQQLKLSGKLKNLAGLIVGGMTNMKDNAIPFGKIAEDIILDAVSEYDYPVCFDFPAGHIDENLALFLGREIEMCVTSKNVSINFL